jgi:CubicO group peptidase (beta-lactamase class C family)
MMRLRLIVTALAGALACGVAAIAQVPQETKPKAPAVAPQVQAPVTPAVTPALTKQDLDGWLDGYMPYALTSGDVAGAVVVVVKDGQVLTEKGYGYADIAAKKKVDPRTTLFRPGSTSKLFVWTAVMQQVEQGKIDLDADVNKYLDFKVPPRDGKPITMRNLMTHTPGYEEHIKRLFVASPDRLQTLGDYMKTWSPKRVYAPGEVPAYSNYGAAMAGYIVERISGEPFDAYIENHVFHPLGMMHSTFRQPLPAQFKADMAVGYPRASAPAKPYELVNARPAGSASATGDDMARFMIAHLQNGQYNGVSILKPETAIQMHTEQKKLNPPLNAMALGFYHEDRNGHVIIGHAGDTELFHSDLHILPGDNIGMFISMNSAGKDGAAHYIRAGLLSGFMDRYFPRPEGRLPTAPTAKEHAKAMEGLYWSSRRIHSSFFAMTNLLGQAKVTAKPDGTLQVSDYKDSSGAVKTWREIGPWLWEDQKGESQMAAVVKGGKVVNFASSDGPPVDVSQRVPGWASSTWNMPLLWFTIATLVLTVVLWPVQVLVRRRYGQSFPHSGRRARVYRLVRGVAVVDLLGLLAYAFVISRLSAGIANLDDGLNLPLRIAQLLCLVGALGSLVALWNVATVWGDRAAGWWAKLYSILLAIACVAFAWFVFSLHLVSASTQF